MIHGISLVIAEVTDMSRSVRFYRDVVGLPLMYESEAWSTVQAGQVSIGLHTPMSESPKGTGWTVVLDVDDLDALRSRLEEGGCEVSPDHEVPAGKIILFCDPDGNQLQAMQRNA